MAVNARTGEFQHIEVFDKPALFTNGRIARDTVPKGWYCYDMRGSDDDPGELCYMEENAVVNHAGSVLMPEKLAMPKSGRLDVRDELGFLDEGNMTLREFCEAHQLPYGPSIGDVAGEVMQEINAVESISDLTAGPLLGFGNITSGIMILFCLILMAYAVVKVFFANLKRGGILLIQIAVGSLYMFSVPRGYTDGFIQWCKQIIGLCLSAFLQATILVAGLMVFKDHALLGLGLMLSAGEIPRIAGAFGLDTSTKANLMSAVYTAQAAVNTTRTVVQAVAK